MRRQISHYLVLKEVTVFLRQLMTFNEAAKHGNFSDAARKLYLTQSAVSHQVKALEQVLGLKLYERHRRGISLTGQGKEILVHVQRIVAHVRDMEECVSALRGGFAGTISVAAHRGIIKYKIPEAVKVFKRSYPTIGIVLSNKILDDEIIAMVASGAVDFGVVTSWSDQGDLEYREFLSYQMFLCVQNDNPCAGFTQKDEKPSLGRIAAEPLILYEPGTAIRKRIDRTFEAEGLESNPVVETGGALVLKEYVKAGLGAAILSGISLDAEPDPEITAVNVSHLFGELGYGFVFRRDKFFTTALIDFINLLDPHFEL